MRNFKYPVLLVIVLVLALFFIGCAKPPEVEKQAAKAAMAAAMAAGTDKYAAANLDAAKQVWDAAEAQMKGKKYKEAKQGYMDAKAAFEKATSAAAAGKKAAEDAEKKAAVDEVARKKTAEADAKKAAVAVAAGKKAAEGEVAYPILPTFGKGPVEVRIYTDYFCGPCQAEEAEVMALITEMVNKNLIRVIFIDTPIHRETVLFAGYFLSGLNAIKNRGLHQAIALRAALFEAASQKIAGKEALELFLKKKGISFQPFDTAPIFKIFSRYLQEDRINSTPTCVIVGPKGKQSLTGKDEILKALHDLRAHPQ